MVLDKIKGAIESEDTIATYYAVRGNQGRMDK
jgi:hypothetical protein